MKAGKNCTKRAFCIAMTILLMVICLPVSFFHAGAAGNKQDAGGRVLFISSYSYGWDTVRMQIEGIMETVGPNVVLDYEFMDTKRVSDDTALQLFYEGIRYRLSQLEAYDVVIVGDDAALLFALQYQEELFDGIPIVFEGVNDEQLAGKAAEHPMITGILEKLSVENNVKLGLALNPKAAKVVAILDDSVTGKAERANYYQNAGLFPQLQFEEINCSAYSSENLIKEFKNVSADSILILVTMSEDASGKRYSSEEAVRIASQNASVPTLRMVEAGIGQGLLGGNVVSMNKSGAAAAQIAMDILNGRDIREIEAVMDSPNIYCVDRNVMDKFGLDLGKLPKETQILNAKESFFERNKEALIPAIILTVALLGIIGVTCFDNIRRRKLLEELEEARKVMESAAQHDFLTKLPNRSKFMADLQELTDHGEPCTVLMMDIDDFKKINDTYGHTAGDEALKCLADRLKKIGSPLLTAYRFAGDEFILILRSTQDKIVEKTAYECRQIFSKPFKLLGENRKVCGSIGVASYPKDAENMEQLIVCADDAMYQVKKNGKNDFAIYHKTNG